MSTQEHARGRLEGIRQCVLVRTARIHSAVSRLSLTWAKPMFDTHSTRVQPPHPYSAEPIRYTRDREHHIPSSAAMAGTLHRTGLTVRIPLSVRRRSTAIFPRGKQDVSAPLYAYPQVRKWPVRCTTHFSFPRVCKPHRMKLVFMRVSRILAHATRIESVHAPVWVASSTSADHLIRLMRTLSHSMPTMRSPSAWGGGKGDENSSVRQNHSQAPIFNP